MFDHNQKYAEIEQYRADAERRASRQRLVMIAREAQRTQRRRARFVALRSARTRLLTVVGGVLVAWGTRLQGQQSTPVVVSAPSSHTPC